MNVLFIEDDAIETMKLHRAIKKLNCNHNIVEAKNGEEALDYLNSDQVKPDIILLDLNMPRMSGIDFLKIMKADDVLKYLPTIIMTTSENRVDLLECYKIGIAGYLVKPLRYNDYQSNLDKIFQYWEINSLVKV